jgi:hypothetical protein
MLGVLTNHYKGKLTNLCGVLHGINVKLQKCHSLLQSSFSPPIAVLDVVLPSSRRPSTSMSCSWTPTTGRPFGPTKPAGFWVSKWSLSKSSHRSIWISETHTCWISQPNKTHAGFGFSEGPTKPTHIGVGLLDLRNSRPRPRAARMPSSPRISPLSPAIYLSQAPIAGYPWLLGMEATSMVLGNGSYGNGSYGCPPGFSLDVESYVSNFIC